MGANGQQSFFVVAQVGRIVWMDLIFVCVLIIKTKPFQIDSRPPVAS
jgi:hypothetical protein